MEAALHADTPHAEKSTNVRSEGGPALALLRALDTVAPALAAELAWALWRTPTRRPRPAREAALLAAAQPLAIPFASGRLAGWRWGEGPAVLLAHGWEGRGAQLGSFIPSLLASGCSVIAFDAPAHGDSPGRTSSLPAFADAISAAARVAGPLQGVIAHSMGAAAALWCLAGGLRAPRAVLVAPPDVRHVLARFQRTIGLSDDVRRRMEERVRTRLGASLEQVSGPRLVEAIESDLLVIHDRGDRFVPWDDGAALDAAGPRVTLRSTTGLGHHRILRDAGVVQAAADFLLA